MSEEPDREELRRRVRERSGNGAPATKTVAVDLVRQFGPGLLSSLVSRGLRNPRAIGTAGVAGGSLLGLGLIGKLLYDKARVRRDRLKAAADHEDGKA